MKLPDKLPRLLIAVCLVLAAGCSGGKPIADKGRGNSSRPTAKAAPKESPPQSNSTTQHATKAKDEAPPPIIKSGFINQDSAAAQSASIAGLSEAAAVEQIGEGIRDSMRLGPTLVVWLFDQSNSAFDIVTKTQQEVVKFYESLALDADKPADDGRLLTAVVAFGSEIEFLLDEPTARGEEVVEALDKYRRDSSGEERTFAALRAALDKYQRFRTQERREVMVVVVTDETADDGDLVDDLAKDTKGNVIPIYVIGVPAPFGRIAALPDSPQDTPIRQGPESRHLERIQLDYVGDPYGLELMDSGFGPFNLERLCRASGGRYLAVRRDASESRFASAFEAEWPSATVYRFDPAVMHRYAPDYVSEEEYQAILSGNKACKALHEAAKLARAEVLGTPPLDFVVTSEAQLNRDLTEAQKGPAKVSKALDELHETLTQGEGDREKLTSPRWQAAYDLAMGRALAAKARVDGYNSMLAGLKQGKAFTNANSTSWVLEPTEVTVEAGSGTKRLCENAIKYLRRVVDEHPGTPWAKIAERELQMKFGWKWSER